MIPIAHTPRFMLVGLVPPRQDKERTFATFEEAQSLVSAYGGEVFAATSQNSTRRDHATFIGTGKAQEVADTIQKEQIEIVVINDNVKPGQLFTLKKIFERSNSKIEVWDRSDLILHIFSKHAATAEAKLQIKLAFMRHMGPRIFGMGMELSQQAGGIGTIGKGETNTERMHRHWKNEIRNVYKQLKKITDNRKRQMDHRKRSGFPTVSLVGYTNSGKTTLYNAISKKTNLTKNSLFSTLDSSVSKIRFSSEHEIYLSDTIGFIENLSLSLVNAFKSTLMETLNSDLVLHVIDVTDPWIFPKIDSVEQVLLELTGNTKNQIYVFNKIDKWDQIAKDDLEKRFAVFSPQFISALGGQGIDELLSLIKEKLPPRS